MKKVFQSNKISSLVAFLLVLISITISGIYKRDDLRKLVSTKKAELSVTPETVKINHLVYGTSKKVIFLLKNPSKTTLFIDEVHPDCKCTVPRLDTYTIKPGEEVILEAIYNADMLGHFRSFIEVYANIDNSPLILTIEGEITESQKNFGSIECFKLSLMFSCQISRSCTNRDRATAKLKRAICNDTITNKEPK